MKRWLQKNGIRLLRAGSLLLCLPLVYVFAALTFPFVEPALSKAAVFSAGLSYPVDARNAAQAFDGSVSQQEPQALEDPDAAMLEPAGDPAEDGEASSAGNLDTPAESVPEDIPAKPDNAGTVIRKTYEPGTGTVYIKTGEGYIKNCTSIGADKVKAAAAQPPKFKIQTSGEPQVLIMHTHATESYQQYQVDWYDKSLGTRTTDTAKNVCRVGDEIAEQLEAAGIGVIHDRTLHDYPSYNGSYERSAVTVKKILKENPSIKVVLDVHRDAIQNDANTMTAPVTTIDGKSCAQVMIISGCDDGTMNMPNYMENLKFSAALQRTMAEDYPTLARPILFDYRKYNQDLTTGSILLEVGGHANTLDEAVYCGELVGKSLAETLLGLQ